MDKNVKLLTALTVLSALMTDGKFFDDDNNITKEGETAKKEVLKLAKSVSSPLTLKIAEATNNFKAIESDAKGKHVQIEAKGIDGKRVTNNIIKKMFAKLFNQGENTTVSYDDVRNFVLNGYHKNKAFEVVAGLEDLAFDFEYKALKGTNVDASMLDNIRAVYRPIVSKDAKFVGLESHIKNMLNTNLKYIQQNILGTNSQGAKKSDSYTYYFELSEDRKSISIVFKDVKKEA